MFAGCGSSRHAAEVAAVWFRRRGIEAEARPATELADGVDGFGGDGVGRVLVGVTQSGATGSLLRLFRRVGDAGAVRIAVTNEAGSPAAELADSAVVTRAGSEEAIPATKTFTSALAALRMLGAEAAGVSGGGAAAGGAVGAIEAGLDRAEEAAAFAEGVAEGPWMFAGEGALRALASEGALKMLETAAVPALSIPSGELAHGPRALLGERTPVVVLSVSAEPGASEARSLAAAAEAGAPVLRVAPGPPPAAFRRDGFTQFDCGAAVVELAPFFAAPVVQLLALYAGAALGRPVDAPEGLTKAVTDD